MKFSLLVFLVLWLNVDISLSQNEPANCLTPPPLVNGDIMHDMKFLYNHYERVEYMCQLHHTMEGGPYKTCINGVWTGQLKCLKPCVVNEDNMRQRNIAFRYSVNGKLYAPHNDVIAFRCTKGRTTDAMRPKCNDGVILLPSCQ